MSWSNCLVENKDKLMGEIMHLFIILSVSVYIYSKALNWWTIMCEGRIILCVRAFKQSSINLELAFEEIIVSLRFFSNGKS